MYECSFFEESLRFLFRQSKIGNPKSKMGGDCYSRCHTRDGRGCGLGAAVNENSADRIPIWLLPFHFPGPPQGIPAGSARAWLRGREKHYDRVAICRGKTRSSEGAC